MTRKHRGNRYRKTPGREKQHPTFKPTPQKPVTSSATQYSYSNYAMCSHWREPFQIDDGLEVRLSGYSDRPKQGAWWAVRYDTISVYLDTMWNRPGSSVMASPGLDLPFPANKHSYVMFPWADMSIPDDMREFKALVSWMLHKIKEGERVEIGCFGGHGRTGTLLACLMVAHGIGAAEAVRRVRFDYCQDAIETIRQVDFVVDFDLEVNHRRPLPNESAMLTKLRADSWKGTGYAYDSGQSTTAYSVGKDAKAIVDAYYDQEKRMTVYDSQSATLESEEEKLDRWLREAEEKDVDPENVEVYAGNNNNRENGWWGRGSDGVYGWQFDIDDRTGSPRATNLKEQLNDDMCAFPPCRYRDQCEPNETHGCHAEVVAEEIDNYQQQVEEMGRWVDRGSM